jgi:hypothetical protein
MKSSSIFLTQAIRKSLPWLCCLIFLIASSDLVSSLESSGVSVASGQSDSKRTNEAGCTSADFTQPATSPEGTGVGPESLAVGDFNLDGGLDLATANFGSANVTILLAVCNTPPTISAQAVSQVAGTSSNNKLIATVTDPDQPLQTLTVTISSDAMNFSNTATLNGVTVSNIAVDSMGQVTATVAAPARQLLLCSPSMLPITQARQTPTRSRSRSLPKPNRLSLAARLSL